MDQRPLRVGEALLPLVVLFTLPAAAIGIPPGIHSAHVADVSHSPDAPNRGEDVRVRLNVRGGDAINSVILTHCRAENYACAPSQEMSEEESDGYSGTIRWEGRFFAQARNVGYTFSLRFANGSEEHSPLRHWPDQPPILPEGAGIYYWYPLPAPAQAPGPGFALTALGLLASLLLGRRGLF